MDEYPKTLVEMERQFMTEEACRQYLAQVRWPAGPRCPRCQVPGGWVTARGLVMCRQCGAQQSVTAGTLFHRSHIPLRTWFRAMWWVTIPKSGANALTLQRLLGLGSYETAWTMLQKLRRAMVRPGRDRLTGVVEVDETFVGGVERGGGRRHRGHKALVVIAAQADGAGIGRIRMRQIPGATTVQLLRFIREAVVPGAKILTDGLPSYDRLPAAGFRHEARVRGADPARASKLLPRVHRVAALLKRWLLGTHQGAVSRDHLDVYLDEFTFRFNRRTSIHRGQLFYRLVQHAVVLDPQPYARLITHR